MRKKIMLSGSNSYFNYEKLKHKMVDKGVNNDLSTIKFIDTDTNEQYLIESFIKKKVDILGYISQKTRLRINIAEMSFLKCFLQ